jgi:hypothetical protein
MSDLKVAVSPFPHLHPHSGMGARIENVHIPDSTFIVVKPGSAAAAPRGERLFQPDGI